MPAPEGYIRDLCALHMHQEIGLRVPTEYSHNLVKKYLEIEQSSLEDLGGFRVDLAVHNIDEGSSRTVASLVEFKLWTGFAADLDIERLRRIVEASNVIGERVEGYVVVSPQYPPGQGMKAVEAAIRDPRADNL